MTRSTSKTFRAAVAALALAAGLMGAAACGKKAPVELAPEVASSDEALFKLGEASLKKDTDKGVLYLRQVIDSFPKSFYAQRAKLLIADSYFKKGDEGNMILAAAEYREFIGLYPYSPSAAYAQYQIAMTFYKKILKPGRDQSKTTQALAEFRQVVTRFPGSDQAKQAEAQIRDCEERLAEQEYMIGTQYYQQKAYKASTGRLSEILTTYPSFKDMDGVYFYIADSYFKSGKADQAGPYFAKLLSDYPKSSYIKKAQERMKEIQSLQAAKKTEAETTPKK